MKDLHILSSGEFTFTADSRFNILHPEGDTSAWTLQLRGAKDTDQGLYECQVNTEPKMKLAILLTVTGVWKNVFIKNRYATKFESRYILERPNSLFKSKNKLFRLTRNILKVEKFTYRPVSLYVV